MAGNSYYVVTEQTKRDIEEMRRRVLVARETGPTFVAPDRTRRVSSGAKDATFLVTLAQDGGNNGGSTSGTAPTWTYTVKDYETGTVLKKDSAGTDATAMSPLAGTRLPAQASAAETGIACRKSDGTLVLIQAHENYGAGSC